jgi:hypothetical protein
LVCALVAFSLPAVAQDALSKQLSLDLKAMAPSEAFKVIANSIGYTVNVDPGVTTPVDIVIPHVTARTALTAICESIGCRWETTGTVIIIKRLEPGDTPGAAKRIAAGAQRRPATSGATSEAVSEFKRKLETVLPADMKFENTPMTVVADRLTQATGISVSFVGKKTGQTLTADLANKTLTAALKTLSERYEGAIMLKMQGQRGAIMLSSGAKKPLPPARK